ncbi:2-polyprenyl-6-methoxyphenol hydroxylase [Mucilaginibacter gossypiicola]|uniref:Flavin-dependent monooxygenase n=1 Tax=Mucilaginibacter gossypiicola TaxID=551995 RepID=A0A1H8NR96_9SPHI|nr:FAD-dependent monooxygenase [Mucilaginibacter gossypiicola]SEO32141.1 2-polyprenyl-6-methoxyphenol hydroxylase [Mucilaginibacter gossypiicola]
MLAANKKIAIIGGGPGGLTLARLLQLNNADVKVYERDVNPEVRVQGATLDLHYESGLKAIKAAGLMDAFRLAYRPGADKGRVVDAQARILYDEHDGQTDEEDLDSIYTRPEIDRSSLRTLLLNSLRSGTVIWDSHLTGLSRQNGAWKLEFNNGTTAVADIVIGADGANSKTRPFVTGYKASYSGVTIVQGNVDNAETDVPDIHRLLAGGKIYAFAGGKYIHVSAKGDGSLDFYLSLKTNENGIDLPAGAQVITWFRKEFPEWGPIWLQLFEKAGHPLLIRPQYCIPFEQTWEAQPDITLLGDAAHIMPPSGEGVNLAMLDALELSDCLCGDQYIDIQSAIAVYEALMRERAAAEARVSLDMMEWMHGSNALDQMVQLLGPSESE